MANALWVCNDMLKKVVKVAEKKQTDFPDFITFFLGLFFNLLKRVPDLVKISDSLKSN